MEKIFTLCPSLKRLSFSESHDAITRMAIAHVMNGGEFKGFYETAVEYLESVQ
jgi:hypothetical protein